MSWSCLRYTTPFFEAGGGLRSAISRRYYRGARSCRVSRRTVPSSSISKRQFCAHPARIWEFRSEKLSRLSCGSGSALVDSLRATRRGRDHRMAIAKPRKSHCVAGSSAPRKRIVTGRVPRAADGEFDRWRRVLPRVCQIAAERRFKAGIAYFAPARSLDAIAHSAITVKYRCTPSAPTTNGWFSPG